MRCPLITDQLPDFNYMRWCLVWQDGISVLFPLILCYIATNSESDSELVARKSCNYLIYGRPFENSWSPVQPEPARCWIIPILQTKPEKKRGTGAVICMCPAPGALCENVLQLPYWYIWKKKQPQLLLFSISFLYCFTARIIYNGVAP